MLVRMSVVQNIINQFNFYVREQNIQYNKVKNTKICKQIIN